MVALREAYEDRDSGIPAIHDAENRLIAWEGGNHFFLFDYKGYFRDLDSGMYYLGPALRSSDLSSIARRATDESEAWGHRYYNPLTGRFLNRDPIREAGGLNLYAHTANDHINRWDFLGLSDADQYEDAKSGDHLQRRSSSFLGFDFTLYGFSHGDWLFRRYHAQNRAYEDWLGERRIPIHIGSGTLRPNFRNPILRYSQQEPGGSFDGLRGQAQGEQPDWQKRVLDILCSTKEGRRAVERMASVAVHTAESIFAEITRDGSTSTREAGGFLRPHEGAVYLNVGGRSAESIASTIVHEGVHVQQLHDHGIEIFQRPGGWSRTDLEVPAYAEQERFHIAMGWRPVNQHTRRYTGFLGLGGPTVNYDGIRQWQDSLNVGSGGTPARYREIMEGLQKNVGGWKCPD